MGRSAGGRLALGLAAAVGVCALAGCLGPSAVHLTRMRYNEAFLKTNDEQLLINIVRLRYADSPVFIDLPTITSQFEASARGNYSGGRGGQIEGRTQLGIFEFLIRDTPTLSYQPRQGHDVARALLTPLTAESIRAASAGANVEQFLLLTVNDVNDVTNAPRATVLVPTGPDTNDEFRCGARAVAELVSRGGAELSVTEIEKEESDPIAASLVRGRDVVEAAKSNLVFRARGDGQMAVLTKERVLTLKLQPGEGDSFEAREMARIFGLTPGLPAYKIRSELSRQNETLPGPLGSDTLLLNMRSVIQMMAFLSKGVHVPPEHVACGVAPTVIGPDGRPFDWTRVPDGLFQVCSGPKRPKDAEVAVQYKGYWFWIARDDVNSKAMLTILDILFSLEQAEREQQGPILTLPVS